MTTPAPFHPDPTLQDDADAREFDAFARAQDPVALQAALWAARRHEGLDAESEAGFQRWLAADARHREAFDAMARSFGEVRRLPVDEIASLKAGLRPAAAPLRPAPQLPRRPERNDRRAFFSGVGRLVPAAAFAGGAAVLVGGSWIGWDRWQHQPTFARDDTTGRGQRLALDLPEGSSLQLDTATQAQVRLYRRRREVRLLEGQAMFTVSADPASPFDVLAGPARITVVGTRFSVRHTQSGLDAGKTVVAVESGRVRVASAGAAVELAAGQGVAVAAAGGLAPIVQLPPAGVGAWRQGRVSFDDTPLAEAIAELERYADTGLRVSDPAVGALRLGGSFDLRQVGTFAQALPHLLPVHLVRRGDVTEIVGVR